MKISLEWLKDFVDLDLNPEQIADLLLRLGMEVEAIEHPDDFSRVVIGLVEECQPLPLSRNYYCRVNVGTEKLDIVCGAPNVRTGMLVPVILIGGRLPDGRVIEKCIIEGRESQGMICSQAELMLGGEADVIWELELDLCAGGITLPGTDLRTKVPPDAVFKLEVTHNRGDCLSHIGVARELAAGLGIELKHPETSVKEAVRSADMVLSVEIRDAIKCPRYCGRVVEEVSVKPSPRWMQKRLLAVGLRPINNIVDVTNYVMMETGHPLHAFDFQLIAKQKIVVKTASEQEKFTTLDGKEYILNVQDLLICDGEKAVAIAGVMGGLNSQITDDTRNILLECAYFQPQSIRRTSRRLGLSTDSSMRFERGVDPNGVPMAIDRAAQLVQMTAGGEVLAGRVDNYARRIQPANIRLRPRRVNRLLGTNLNSQTIADCLSRLGMEVKKTGLEHEVTVPTFRPDLIEEIDLVEEIIRIYGYNRVKTAKRADISLEVEPLPEEETDQIIKSALVELGLDEVLTYGMRAANREGLDKTAGVAIRNPLSYDFAFLRSDLLAPLLEVVAHNLNHGAESVRIFELGHIFSQSTPIKVEERKQLAGILAGKVQNTFWGAISEEFDFFYLKGMVEDFLRKAALDNYQFTPYIKDDNYFEDAQKVLISGEEAGAFGELKREIIRGFDIEIPVFCFHFDYQVLSRCWQVIRPFIPYSRQPAVKRDLSVVIDEGISSQEIEKSVYENGSEYLTKLEFFDLYRGAQLGAGKKSLSLALKFQAPERTLTDTEVDEVINQIVSGLHKLGGVLRSK